MNLLCVASNSCYDINIKIPSISTNSLLWNCKTSTACSSLLCVALSACSSVGMNDLNIDCISCTSLDINANVNKLNIDCTYCYQMIIIIIIINMIIKHGSNYNTIPTTCPPSTKTCASSVTTNYDNKTFTTHSTDYTHSSQGSHQHTIIIQLNRHYPAGTEYYTNYWQYIK